MLPWHVWICDLLKNYYHRFALNILRKSSREWRNGTGEKGSVHADEEVLVNIAVGVEVKGRPRRISGPFTGNQSNISSPSQGADGNCAVFTGMDRMNQGHLVEEMKPRLLLPLPPLLKPALLLQVRLRTRCSHTYITHEHWPKTVMTQKPKFQVHSHDRLLDSWHR